MILVLFTQGLERAQQTYKEVVLILAEEETDCEEPTKLLAEKEEKMKETGDEKEQKEAESKVLLQPGGYKT